jgi:hypothetical protein
MTALEYREYTLTCDYEGGCSAQFGPLNREMPRAQLRKLAAKSGWTHVRGELGSKYDDDFCPAHKPQEG